MANSKFSQLGFNISILSFVTKKNQGAVPAPISHNIHTTLSQYLWRPHFAPHSKKK